MLWKKRGISDDEIHFVYHCYSFDYQISMWNEHFIRNVNVAGYSILDIGHSNAPALSNIEHPAKFTFLILSYNLANSRCCELLRRYLMINRWCLMVLPNESSKTFIMHWYNTILFLSPPYLKPWSQQKAHTIYWNKQIYIFMCRSFHYCSK